MDEPTLLADLAADLDNAFETLVRARQDRLYSIALRILGDPGEAEDAAQDAFIRAYRALRSWDAERIGVLRLDAWLATIVVNVARSRTRRRARTVERESLTFLDELEHPVASPPAGATATDTPDARLDRREATDAWAQRLMALPERYRAPVVLRHIDGLGYDEIALALERPEGTVKAQVHRGLELLRAALDAEARGRPIPHPSASPPAPAVRLQEVHR